MEKKEVWWSKSISDVFKKLDSAEEGLSSKEVARRTETYGFNEIRERKKTSVMDILLLQFKSFVVWVLFVAALLSFIVGHKIEVVVILIILGFIILLSFFEEYKASKDIESLLKLAPKRANVLRDDTVKQINAGEVTVGDILVLRRGDIVAADARLIESNNIKIDESTLTGESVPVDKKVGEVSRNADLSQQINMVFASTSIVNGDGLAIVVEIGENTEIGKISSMIGGIKEEITPLQKRLDKLTEQISIGAILLALFIFVLGIFRGNEWGIMLIFSMAILVSAIPESLPTVVAVTLAAGVKKMAHKNAVIKRMPAVETLGTCSVICSDKTGTLTQNKMVIENIFTADSEVSITGQGYNPKGIFLKEDIRIDPKKHKTLPKIFEIGILCNNSDIKKERGRWTVDGEATEGALVVLARKAGLTRQDYHKKFPRKKEHPFDPVRKCMSVVHFVRDRHMVYSKGAPELLLNKAKYYLHEGSIRRLNKSLVNMFLKKNKEYASKGLRVIGLAFKEHRGSFELKDVESSLVFVGLVSIRDPPEPSAKESIRKCKEAGTKVVMITGDNEITAKAIAEELGIYSGRDMVLTGKQLDRMSDKEFEKIVDYVTVYARVAPKHKLKIVETLQKKGHIVAMTGDGVNDAPALKKADIGVAMGRSGTEVAKESAEMILKDDNFTTIVNAIEQGRTIYSNIRKFIYYLLVGNFSEVILVLVAVIAGVNLPLTALMILFLNLVTSDIPALGMSAEKPSEKIMRQKPRNPKEGILSDYLLLKISELVPLVVLGTLALYMWELIVNKSAVPKAQTVAFATIILFELFHAFNARSWDESLFTKKFFSNIYIIGGVLLSAVLSMTVIYWPPMQAIFGTVSLALKDWIPIVMVSFSIIFFLEIQKTLINSEIEERKKVEIYPTRGVNIIK